MGLVSFMLSIVFAFVSVEKPCGMYTNCNLYINQAQFNAYTAVHVWLYIIFN